jgi:hypothetical protein
MLSKDIIIDKIITTDKRLRLYHHKRKRKMKYTICLVEYKRRKEVEIPLIKSLSDREFALDVFGYLYEFYYRDERDKFGVQIVSKWYLSLNKN